MKIDHLGQLIGKRVVVTADCGSAGFSVAPRHLNARRIGAVGTVQAAVPGHGGDVVSVLQENTPPGQEAVGVYCHWSGELEFYSVDTLLFALLKAKQVKELEAKLKHLKEERFRAT